MNPQVPFANRTGNSVRRRSFPTNGPIREARFIRNANGSADGGVHSLFAIRPAVHRRTSAQPSRNTRNNVIFRIPTPVFGAGLIEQIPDSAILANQAAMALRSGRWESAGA